MQMSPLVIFDSEFTAWEGSWENNWSRPGEYPEIIQIAAAIIDSADQYKVKSKFDILVKPLINPSISTYIQQLTEITQAQIDTSGVDFSHAMKAFHAFCKQGMLHAYCWGTDQDKFIETSQLNGLSFSDYFENFYDIRDVFEKSGIETSKYQSGTVYKSMGLSFQEKQHNVMSDVKSIIITLQALHKKGTLKEPSFLNCSISRSTS
jgi:inhibitor of KinA sporulation pathway (predicted exonuclease)